MLVCITGIVGSGKTTILNELSKKGYKTFEMDEYVHSIYNANEIGYAKIKECFGEQFVNQKEVDRKKLGMHVFNSPTELTKLNNIMIPLMIDKIKSIDIKEQPVFVELAIFLNHINEFEKIFKHVIVIHGKKEIQDEKSKKHNINISQIFAKCNKNNRFITIENNGTIDSIKNKAEEILHKLKNL